MNGAFLHIATNHIPVVGIPLAVLVLLFGLIKKSRDVIQASFILFVLMGLVTVFVYKTGGPAARTLMTYPGVEVERASIHEHAEAADKGGTAAEAVAVVAFIGLFLLSRPGPGKIVAILVLLGGMAATVLLGITAHKGGLIRHPEISSASENAEESPSTPAPPAPK